MSDPVVLLSTGDVVGPAGGVTDNSMVLFSGTSGKIIKGNNAAVTAAGLALLDDVNAAAQRVTLGLGNVDNTSDVNKPISTATQTALNLKATIDSPTFTGDPKAPIPPQFDSDFSLATTGFVQRALGNFSGMQNISGTATLTAGDIGKLLVVAGTSSYSITLPTVSALAQGSTITLTNTVAFPMTILPGAGNSLSVAGFPSPVVLPPYATMQISCDGDTVWRAILLSPGNPTWQSVIASRALGTTYTNSTGRTIAISFVPVALSNRTHSLTINGSVIASLTYGTATVKAQLFGIVPPGVTYKVDSNSTIETWMELR